MCVYIYSSKIMNGPEELISLLVTKLGVNRIQRGEWAEIVTKYSWLVPWLCCMEGEESTEKPYVCIYKYIFSRFYCKSVLLLLLSRFSRV